MPANIAHMVIAHKALEKLKSKQGTKVSNFAEIIDDTSKAQNSRSYMNLGSIGPDLYYYCSKATLAKDMLTEGFVQAKGVTPWAYHLHSNQPNMFPLKLSEILFSDAIRENGKTKLEADDIRKLAYIAGHLTHIAADQIIHPVVNRIAKPYYRSGDNRKKHRRCEVFQDYFLYEEVYRDKRAALQAKKKATYDFFKQNFNKWVDCVPGLTTKNTEDWFRYFLQRGFVEAYGVFPLERQIENSADNLLLMLRACKWWGPYKKAKYEYDKYGPESKMYKEYITKPEYVKYYDQAIELSAIYIEALCEVYSILKAEKDFTEEDKERFLSIVRGADLSCPLEQNIYDKAYAALMNKKDTKTKCKELFA